MFINTLTASRWIYLLIILLWELSFVVSTDKIFAACRSYSASVSAWVHRPLSGTTAVHCGTSTHCQQCTGWKKPHFSPDSMCLCTLSTMQKWREGFIPFKCIDCNGFKAVLPNIPRPWRVFSETRSHFQFHWG